MELRIEFQKLEALVRELGLTRYDFALRRPEDPWRIFEGDIEVGSGDVGGAGGILTYEDVQVLLYIKDTRHTENHIATNPHESKKFHIAWCEVLERMLERGRFNRYVVTRRDTGLFKVDVRINEFSREQYETEAKLLVCQSCLKFLNYQDFETLEERDQRRKAVERFDIGAFLKEYENIVRYLTLPQQTDENTPVANYDAAFTRMSQSIKMEQNFRCKNCGVDLRQHRWLLHCHHIDHNRTNNNSTNLIAICAYCHQKEHPHMFVRREYLQTIKTLREQQGLA